MSTESIEPIPNREEINEDELDQVREHSYTK